MEMFPTQQQPQAERDRDEHREGRQQNREMWMSVVGAAVGTIGGDGGGADMARTLFKDAPNK